MKVACVAAGISVYPEGSVEALQHLRYAAKAAGAFAAFVREVWPQSSPAVLEDEAATLVAVEEACAAAGGGPLDLFLLFLAGHGAADADGAGTFCTASWRPGDPDLDGARLEAMLEPLDSKLVLVVLDCCFAAAVTSSCPFFHRLPARQTARLYLCASGADELAWEDESLELPIFTASLLKILHSRPPEGPPPRSLDLEAELYPRLRDEVAAQTHRLKKGHRQRVLRGGISHGPVSLPLAAGEGWDDSNWGLATRAAIRRTLVTLAAVLLLSVVAVQVSFFHISPTEDGRLQVLHGVDSLSFLLPRPLERRMDLAIDADELIAEADEVLGQRIQDGGISGIWWQNDSAGRRRWASDLLSPFELGDLATSLQVRLGETVDEDELEDATGEGYEWLYQIAVDQALLRGSRDAEVVEDFLWNLGASFIGDIDEYACSPEQTDAELREFAFTFTAYGSHRIASVLWHAVQALPANPRAVAELLPELAKALAYRANSGREHIDATSEAGALVELLRALADTGLPGEIVLDELPAATDDACWAHYDLVRVALEKPLMIDVESKQRHLTTLAGREPLAPVSLQVLALMARRGALDADDFDQVVSLARAPSEAQPPSEARRPEPDSSSRRPSFDHYHWLGLSSGGLPAGSAYFAGALADEAALRNDMITLEELARSAANLDAGEAAALRSFAEAWVEDWQLDILPRQGQARALSHLVENGILPPEAMEVFWPEDADIEIEFSWQRNPQNRVQRLRAGVTDWSVIVAVARTAPLMELSQEQWSVLESLADRFAFGQPLELEALYRALAARAAADWHRESVRAVLERLEANRHQARRLVTETGTAAAWVRSLDGERRGQVLEALRRSWRNEREPEIKLALATIILAGERTRARFGSLLKMGEAD